MLEQEELPLVGPQLPQLGGGAEGRLPVDAAAGSGRIGGMREVRHEMGWCARTQNEKEASLEQQIEDNGMHYVRV